MIWVLPVHHYSIPKIFLAVFSYHIMESILGMKKQPELR